MEALQGDIFGNFISIDDIDTAKPMETIKSAFRRRYGYDESHRCGDCRHCEAHFRQKTYYKCRLMGISASEATDIRLKDPACSMFQKNV